MPDSYTVVSTADPSRPGFYTYEQVRDEHPVVDTRNQADMGPGWDPITRRFRMDVGRWPVRGIVPRSTGANRLIDGVWYDVTGQRVDVDPGDSGAGYAGFPGPTGKKEEIPTWDQGVDSLTALQIEQAADPYYSEGHYHSTLEQLADPYHHGEPPRLKHVNVQTIGEDADALEGQLHLGGVDRRFHPITGMLLAADRLINVLSGGEDETVSARVGRGTYTGSGSNIIANVLDRIDPGHTFRAVANSPINRLPCVPASYARAIAKQIKCR